MQRVRLIHCDASEGEKRAAWLRSAGYDAAFEVLTPASLRKLREDPPIAVVIDLSRLPSQGRDVALALRRYRETRSLPLVFVGGLPQILSRIRQLLPDAVCTTWDRIRTSLQRTIAHPPVVTAVPRSLLQGYSGTPLLKKLGIKANSAVALVHAPPEFEQTLGELPEGVTVREEASDRANLTIWFVRSRKELEHSVGRMAAPAEKGGLWIAWPKKTSPIATDLTQAVVREIGLAAGLVDYKVCAIDATWSGLKFSRRKSE